MEVQIFWISHILYSDVCIQFYDNKKLRKFILDTEFKVKSLIFTLLEFRMNKVQM